MPKSLQRLGVVLLLLAIGSAACGGDEPEVYLPPILTEEASRTMETGEHLYTRDCAWCHGVDGTGTEYGTDLSHVGTASIDLYLSTGRMPLDRPTDRPERADPAYTDEQIETIVRYTAGLTDGPDIPEVDIASGDLAVGAELYLQACAQCHSATGTGSILTSGIEVPDLYHATAEETAESMLVGVGAMPRFGPDTFTAEEVDSIVAYVLALNDDYDQRGGWALGKYGPVTEGVVAWLIGTLALVIVIRAIGTREN